MLDRLVLRDFQSWQNLDLELKPITVIFGTNSSGKTALLRSLLMLKQSVESYDRKRSLSFAGRVDLGSYQDVVYGNRPDGELAIGLDWTPEDTVVLWEPDDGGKGKPITADKMTYEAKWRRFDSDVGLVRLRYSANGTNVLLESEDGERYVLTLSSNIKRRVGKPWPLARPESCYAMPRSAARESKNVDLLEFNHQFELLMERTHYMGPLRQHPSRLYTWSGDTPRALWPQGEAAVDALLAAVRQRPPGKVGKRQRDDLLSRTQQWLRAIGMADAFDVRSLTDARQVFEVRVKPSTSAVAASLTDVGFGVSQVLPIVVQLLFVPEKSILLFEQPEIHLHPNAQANLADLFLEVAQERQLQLILESHSEHFLARLQRRIAENEQALASPARVALYYCELVEGASQARPVMPNLFGEIADWPERFFGDIVGDIEAMTRAGLQRRRGGTGR